MDQLKGIEKKSKPPKYMGMIQLFGDCYSASSIL